MPNCKSRFAILTGENLLKEVLLSWQNEISQKRDGQEPRRALAEKLSKLGNTLSSRSQTNEQYNYVSSKFDKLAKVSATLFAW